MRIKFNPYKIKGLIDWKYNRMHKVLSVVVLSMMIGLPSAYGNIYSEVSTMTQQNNKIKVVGSIKDANGEPIIGATIVDVKTNVGTITSIDGDFELEISVGTELTVSFLGYTTLVVKVPPIGRLNIVMNESTETLDEVEVVAYGAQKKVTVVGAISSVKGDVLTKTPAASINNMLSGQLSGVSTVQYSGEPGADAAEIYVRGIATMNNSTPLIQVDGVERDMSQIDPNEIESVTILKDASATAVFGVRGANGVILITTKRGEKGKAKISFSTSTGVNVMTKQLEFADSYQYASYVNEMRVNDGGDPLYGIDILDAFRYQTDPIMYPSIDWVDYCMEDYAPQSQHNVSISGGTDKMRYFVSLGAFSQEGMFKTFGLDDFNFNYDRYNYRANLDFDLSKSTLLSVNLGGIVSNRRTPESGEDQNQLFRKLYWAVPFAGAGIVDGNYIKTNSDVVPSPGVDGLSSYYGKGFRERTSNNLTFDMILDQKLNFITKGLSFKVKGSYNSSYTVEKVASSSVANYTPVYVDDVLEYRKSGADTQTSYSTGGLSRGRNWYLEGSLNYNRTFGDHSVGALVLYNQSKTYYPSSFSHIPTGYIGMVGRATYDWKDKYMAEFNVGYNGSENFNPDNRYGFFPAGSLGWAVSEEEFFAPLKGVVSFLKLRASMGIVGNDKYGNQRFYYIPTAYSYNGSGGYYFGENISGSSPEAYEGTQSNVNATWETAVKQNYGIDFTLWEKLSISADYFKEHRSDILINPVYTPSIVGLSLSAVNVGEVENKGYEVTAKWNHKLNDNFRYWTNFNVSFSRNKILFINEVRPNESYLAETGNKIGSRLMRSFWGFYDETADQRYKDEFGTSIADHGITLQYGDAVYNDLNSDGVIDADDSTRELGYTDVPEYTAGLNLGFQWKNIDISTQWTGAWNVDRMLSEFRQPLGDTQNKGLLLYQYENTWRSSEDTFTAAYPRATSTNASNNYASSDLYLIDASYLRLKSFEIGYSFNMPFMKKLSIDKLRVYANGYNLLTFSNFKWGDPESRQSDRPNYPLTKVFNVGLKLDF